MTTEQRMVIYPPVSLRTTFFQWLPPEGDVAETLSGSATDPMHVIGQRLGIEQSKRCDGELFLLK
jgi:hypothetical protein